VTGAASGIGRATAVRLATEGLRVVGLDRDPVDLPGVEGRQVDLLSAPDVARALDGVERVHRLVSCAGLTGAAGAERVLTVNVLALREITSRVLELMPDGGSVTHVASVGAHGWEHDLPSITAFLDEVDREGLGAWCRDHAERLRPSAYPFSKRCVVVETLRSAARLAPRRIRVNAVAPGLVDTPMVAAPAAPGPGFVEVFPRPFGRMTTAAEQAEAIGFLSGPAAGAVSGTVLPTDHGLVGAVAVGARPSPFPSPALQEVPS